jgi:transcriptional regulator with XRE-family HTH domain
MIGDTLKRLRNIYGYKAIELSKELGISSSYLSEIENNKKVPSIDLLQKYASIFGIKASSLLRIVEVYEAETKKDDAQDRITRMMISLIDKMSKEDGESDDGEGA